MDEERPRVQPHLWIAGTGRAGTSFLVRYLAELGLDTHLGRFGEHATWDEEANAGLEDAPLPGLNGTGLNNDLPYVVKSPWLYQFIDDLLANNLFAADAVVIPVRDLAEATVSRSINERRAIHQNVPWMSEGGRIWEEWCHVAGGVTYSLNPIDQGRLLAVGFHHLVQRLIAADIRVIFLAFPRFIEDPAYLFARLRPVLPSSVGREMAWSAHQRLADRSKVRVCREIEAVASAGAVSSAKVVSYESEDLLDSVAMRRELARLRRQLSDARTAAARAEEQVRCGREAAADQEATLRDVITMTETASAATAATLQQAVQQKADLVLALRREVDQCHQQVQGLIQGMSELQRQVAQAADRKHGLERALDAILNSRSWRLTRPYRAVGLRLQRAVGPRLRAVLHR